MDGKINVHYIWVGKPTGNSMGHDVAGPSQMIDSVNSSVAIFFWCLDDCVKFYQKIFEKKFIEVQSIEKFLRSRILSSQSGDQKISDTSKFSLKLIELSQKIIFQKNRGRVRDLMTFKNVFS